MHCAEVSEDIVVEFGDDLASAVLTSDVLINESTIPSACLSLQLSITSPVVNITVAVSSSLENLATSSQVVTITNQSCLPRRWCYWEGSFMIDSGERLFITARKFRATRGSSTFAFITNTSLTPGNCYSHSTDSELGHCSYTVYLHEHMSNFVVITTTTTTTDKVLLPTPLRTIEDNFQLFQHCPIFLNICF